jgi:hypothetical protein
MFESDGKIRQLASLPFKTCIYELLPNIWQILFLGSHCAIKDVRFCILVIKPHKERSKATY